MMNFSQGDIIKISNLKDAMLVVSKNEFIKKTSRKELNVINDFIVLNLENIFDFYHNVFMDRINITVVKL